MEDWLYFWFYSPSHTRQLLFRKYKMANIIYIMTSTAEPVITVIIYSFVSGTPNNPVKFWERKIWIQDSGESNLGFIYMWWCSNRAPWTQKTCRVQYVTCISNTTQKDSNFWNVWIWFLKNPLKQTLSVKSQHPPWWVWMHFRGSLTFSLNL